jgi:hypothetical protein
VDLIGAVVGTALWFATSYVAVRLFTRRAISRVLGAMICGCSLSLGTMIGAWPAAFGATGLFAFLLVTQAVVGAAIAYLILPAFLMA